MTFRIHDTSITCSTLFFGDSNSYISTSYYKITINLFLHQLVVRITRQVRVKAAAFSPTFRALPAKRVSGEKVFQMLVESMGKNQKLFHSEVIFTPIYSYQVLLNSEKHC